MLLSECVQILNYFLKQPYTKISDDTSFEKPQYLSTKSTKYWKRLCKIAVNAWSDSSCLLILWSEIS